MFQNKGEKRNKWENKRKQSSCLDVFWGGSQCVRASAVHPEQKIARITRRDGGEMVRCQPAAASYVQDQSTAFLADSGLTAQTKQRENTLTGRRSALEPLPFCGPENVNRAFHRIAGTTSVCDEHGHQEERAMRRVGGGIDRTWKRSRIKPKPRLRSAVG